MDVSPELIKRVHKSRPVDGHAAKYKAVTPVDLYDFYGIASLSRKALTPEFQERVSRKLKDLRQLFLDALQARFNYWRGGEAISINKIVEVMKNSLEDEIMKQAKLMQSGLGGGFNMLAAVAAMRGDTKVASKKMEAETIKLFAENLKNFKSADYPKIAKGVVDLFEAETDKDIILSIDFLNDLQHCGGYVLVDFVAGQRDPTNTLGNKVMQEILDFKRDVVSPMDFAKDMSAPILEVVKSQWGENESD